MPLRRTPVLMEESQYRRLQTLARGSGRSVSALVRQITADYLERTSLEEVVHCSPLAALDALSASRREIEKRHGVLPITFLDEMRSERDEELFRIGVDHVCRIGDT
jgi:hypothetical protein